MIGVDAEGDEAGCVLLAVTASLCRFRPGGRVNHVGCGLSLEKCVTTLNSS